jgi:DNA polymerase III epsilon subunit-like protein
MISKLFHKEYPEFWKKYTESFKNPATKYVVISMETSGLDTEKDVIMSIAATSIVENRILLKDSFEIKFSAAHMVIRLLNNHIQAAKYMYNNGWIFVCSHDNIIITIERQDDKKFGKDLFKVDQQEKNDVSKNHSAGSGL